MRFKGAKKQLLRCLRSGSVLHQERTDIDIKNLLAVGQVTLEEVADVVGRARGNSYRQSPHHQVENLDVHIIETRHDNKNWYIKWYFIDPNSVFISVHH